MYVVFDIGGTKTRVAVSEDLEKLHGDPVKFDSTGDFDADAARIIEEANKLLDGTQVKGAAGGIAGVLNAEKSKLLRSPNKQSWVGEPLKKTLEDAFGADVLLENDTAVVGLGEAHYGGGRGFDIVAYVTVSTGVGGVKIEHGNIDDRSVGFEPGHQIINPHCKVCSSCTVGAIDVKDECADLEQLVSGTALEKFTGQKPFEVEDPVIWHLISAWLALGLNNTAVHWSPHAFVLGGSMVCGTLGEVIGIEDVEEHLRDVLTIFPEIPEIKKAELGDFGGLYGGMALLRQQLHEDTPN